MKRFDYVLAGGGLQNGLVALALARQQPGASVALVEADDRLGGNHTWSFHAADVPAGAAELVRPLVVASWPGYEVRFPGHHRTLASPYATITCERFDAVLRSAARVCGWDLRLGSRVEAVASDGVALATGERLAARCVIDSRGPLRRTTGCGYQKFVGLEVETDRPWPDRLPTVMDAAVAQSDGFHFLYTLPFSPTRVLVEDTFFSDTPALDAEACRRRVTDYLEQRTGRWRILREESGVLPMPWSADLPEAPGNGPVRGGYSGGWFHPATGYSFPAALRFALAVAAVPPEAARGGTAALAQRLRPRWAFARFLNWLLFRLVPPDGRWQVFARLYRTLSPAVLARFYALEFSAADAARIVFGRPPRVDPLRPFRRPGSI